MAFFKIVTVTTSVIVISFSVNVKLRLILFPSIEIISSGVLYEKVALPLALVVAFDLVIKPNLLLGVVILISLFSTPTPLLSTKSTEIVSSLEAVSIIKSVALIKS